MNLNPPKVVLHTDVILEFLLAKNQQTSVMRKALNRFFCYTTVFHAMELFSIAKTPAEVHAVEDAMSAMKILGLNAKSAPKYSEVLRVGNVPKMNALVAGLCLESKLPILTHNPSGFRKIKGLTVLTPDDIFPTKE